MINQLNASTRPEQVNAHGLRESLKGYRAKMAKIEHGFDPSIQA
jgi:hypothetical protein